MARSVASGVVLVVAMWVSKHWSFMRSVAAGRDALSNVAYVPELFLQTLVVLMLGVVATAPLLQEGPDHYAAIFDGVAGVTAFAAAVLTPHTVLVAASSTYIAAYLYWLRCIFFPGQTALTSETYRKPLHSDEMRFGVPFLAGCPWAGAGSNDTRGWIARDSW